MATVDSIGIKNVKRFKDIFFRERGIWFSIDDLQKLIDEIKAYEGYDLNGKEIKKEDEKGVGFWVGIGSDHMFNVEVIPLYGKKETHGDEGKDIEFEVNKIDEELRKANLQLIYFSHKVSSSKVSNRKVTWDGGVLIRDSSTLNQKLIEKNNAKALLENGTEPYEGNRVIGIYDGEIQVTHELTHNEGQRIPPPYN